MRSSHTLQLHIRQEFCNADIHNSTELLKFTDTHPVKRCWLSPAAAQPVQLAHPKRGYLQWSEGWELSVTQTYLGRKGQGKWEMEKRWKQKRWQKMTSMKCFWGGSSLSIPGALWSLRRCQWPRLAKDILKANRYIWCVLMVHAAETCCAVLICFPRLSEAAEPMTQL